MAKDCEKHRGETGSVPPELEDLMGELPENQSGAGRHKCGHLRQRPDFAFRSASRVGGSGISPVPADSEVRIA